MANLYGFTFEIDTKGAVSNLKVLENVLKSVESKIGNIKKPLLHTATHLDNIGNSASKAYKPVKSMSDGFGDMFASMTAAGLATSAIQKLGAALIQTFEFGKEMEQTRIAFDTMMGSAENGGKMFEQLKKWADITPFDNKTAFDAGKLLMNYGVEAKNVVKYMTMLGDASGGNTDKFQGLALALGQTISKGRLMGQEAMQMTERGFSPLQEISQMTGKSMLQLSKEMEKGQISTDLVLKAFENATGAGGRFFGMMEKQSQTVGGLMSTLESAGQTMMYGIFQSGSPMMGGFIKQLTEAANLMADIFTPKESEKFGENINNMNAMFGVLQNQNISYEERSKLIADINSQYGQYLPNQLTEANSIMEIGKAQFLANQVLDDKIKLMVREETISDYVKELKENEVKLRDARILKEKTEQGTSTLTERILANPLDYATSVLSVANAPMLVYTVANTLLGENAAAKNELDGIAREGHQKDNRIKQANKDLKELENKQLDLKIKTNQFLNPNQKSTGLTPGLNLFAPVNFGKNVDYLKDAMSNKNPFENFNPNKKIGELPPTNNLTGGSLDLAGKGASGGLGEAKVITINIDKFTEVNTSSFSTKDLEKTTTEGIADLIQAFENAVYTTGER